MNSSNATVAAALATIEVLETENPYDRMYQYGKKLMEGIRQVATATNQNLLVQGHGPMFNTGFTDLKSVNDYRDTLSFDKNKLKKFISGMQESNIRIIGRGLWYISTAHTEADIDEAIEKATEVLKNM
ncbi:MAG: hypothetical protein ABI325_09025 [Ginsengibacter sp.]